jgi:NAD(P)-dependent dehydrogenase (short-subunit alcohol dehydrogenase family)
LLTTLSGIGLETAILFLREGANVLLSDISGPALERAIGILKKIVPDAKKVETKITDVSKEADVQAMVEHVRLPVHLYVTCSLTLTYSLTHGAVWT